MKIKIDLELPEADVIFKALNIIDPTNLFCKQLKDKIAQAAKPAVDEKEKESK